MDSTDGTESGKFAHWAMDSEEDKVSSHRKGYISPSREQDRKLWFWDERNRTEQDTGPYNSRMDRETPHSYYETADEWRDPHRWRLESRGMAGSH